MKPGGIGAPGFLGAKPPGLPATEATGPEEPRGSAATKRRNGFPSHIASVGEPACRSSGCGTAANGGLRSNARSGNAENMEPIAARCAAGTRRLAIFRLGREEGLARGDLSQPPVRRRNLGRATRGLLGCRSIDETIAVLA